jgi:hypothetical protein
MTPRKIIIDTDPGQDDAAAIMLALASPELEVLGYDGRCRQRAAGTDGAQCPHRHRNLRHERYSGLCGGRQAAASASW